MNADITHIDFYLIGMGNDPQAKFSSQILELVKSASVFSGGKRHREIAKHQLPKGHQWIEIAGSMADVVNQYELAPKPVIIFVSGDPFFYGFGNTLRRLLPQAMLKAFPYFNSIQLLCHKTNVNYNELKAVSVHGRDWSALDEALIAGSTLIGVLTDASKTPAKIAKRMLDYGFDNYDITIGESLDGENERIQKHSLLECQQLCHNTLNCVLLQQTKPKKLGLGIPDSQFKLLDGRVNMITKLPIRLCTLHALELNNAQTLWDIGACTGSVSIEAKRCFPHLHVIAIEKRESCNEIIKANAKSLSAPGIDVMIDDFFALNHAEMPLPDVVFIGGHGGRLKEMISWLNQLNPDLRFVVNAVQESTNQTFVNELTQLGYTINTTRIKVNRHNEIAILKALKK